MDKDVSKEEHIVMNILMMIRLKFLNVKYVCKVTMLEMEIVLKEV